MSAITKKPMLFITLNFYFTNKCLIFQVAWWPTSYNACLTCLTHLTWLTHLTSLTLFQVASWPTSCSASSSTCTWSRACWRTGWSLRTAKPGSGRGQISSVTESSWKPLHWEEESIRRLPMSITLAIPTLLSSILARERWQSVIGRSEQVSHMSISLSIETVLIYV